MFFVMSHIGQKYSVVELMQVVGLAHPITFFSAPFGLKVFKWKLLFCVIIWPHRFWPLAPPLPLVPPIRRCYSYKPPPLSSCHLFDQCRVRAIRGKRGTYIGNMMPLACELTEHALGFVKSYIVEVVMWTKLSRTILFRENLDESEHADKLCITN
jgi:hypothetical protein